LILIFYILNIKYPSISFDLKETFKTYKDIINENEELKKENELLKNKLKNKEEYIKNLESTIKSFGNDKDINIFIKYNDIFGKKITQYSFKMKDKIDYLSSVFFEKNELTYEFDNNLAYYGILKILRLYLM